MIAIIVRGKPITRHEVNTFNVYLVMVQVIHMILNDRDVTLNVMVNGKCGWPVSGKVGMDPNEIKYFTRSLLAATGVDINLSTGEKETLWEAFPEGYVALRDALAETNSVLDQKSRTRSHSW